MTKIDEVVNLTDQYAEHKWTLRRVLLSDRSFGDLSENLRTQFPDAEISLHEVDAIWFSRKNRDSETWELRRLGSPPFALVEVIDDVLSVEERENKLASLELEMSISRPSTREH